MDKNNNQQKQRLIRLIHVAKRELCMEDDTYRSVLLRVGNSTSSKDLSVSKLEAVLEHFKKAGFKVVPKKKSNLSMASDPQSKIIRGLWLELHEKGIVNDPSEYALSKYVQRITSVSALQWLDAQVASRIIETLKSWLKREVDND